VFIHLTPIHITEDLPMLKPLGDRVLVEIVEDTETKTAGGLYVPDSAKEKSQRGRVVAVGNGKVLENGTRMAVEVNVGDVVYFAKYGGTEVTLEGKNYSLLAERDILAIVE
jgi:chaperonin GroES